jgi:ParB family chromosome partitioning protein
MSTPPTSLRAFDQLANTKRQNRGTPLPQIPLTQIAPLAGQPRKHMDPTALAELAESIKSHGVIQPIVLISRKNAAETDTLRYSIVCGERRFRAAILAGLDAIPALVRDYEDGEVALIALLENLQREDLTPLEEAEYLAQLKLRYDFTEEQLGERLGKSRDYVHMRTRLLNLNPDILALWREAATPEVFERLTPSHAILVNQLADAFLRQGLASAVVENGLTVAETRRRLESVKSIALVADDLSPDEMKRRQVAAVDGLDTAPPLAKMPARAKIKLVPAAPPVEGNSAGPRLALEDLAIYSLLAPRIKAGHTDVHLRELVEALEQDLAWVKRIAKDGLANG